MQRKTHAQSLRTHVLDALREILQHARGNVITVTPSRLARYLKVEATYVAIGRMLNDLVQHELADALVVKDGKRYIFNRKKLEELLEKMKN